MHLFFCLSLQNLATHYPHLYPQPAGDEAPEGDEEAVAPVDGDDRTAKTDAADDGFGHAARVELEGIVVAVGEERGADEAGADVMEMDVTEAADGAELLQALHVGVDISFRGGIGGCGTESAGAGDAADDGEVGFVVRTLCQIVEGCADDACHAHGIGLDSGQFTLHVEGRVLIADARTVEDEVHRATHLSDELEQTVGGVGVGHVELLRGHDVEVLTLNFLQTFLTTSCDADLPTLFGQHLRHFEPDARCGTDDNGAFNH